MTSFIPQIEPRIEPEDQAAVAVYLQGGGWLTEHRVTADFESALASFTGARHAIATTSGTAALFLAMRAAGLQPGDEVLIPDFTMVASATSALLAGATPVLVDVAPDNLCIDLKLAERAITRRTKALLVVSLNGRAPDMVEARRFADQHELVLIEDACQSLGSSWRLQQLGTFGALGTFSFSPHKIITTGQGGAVVTNDDRLAARCRALKDFGRDRPGSDHHPSVGYNFKFTDLQATIGLQQLARIETRISQKRQLFLRYQQEFSDIAAIKLAPTELTSVCPWFVDIFVPDPAALKHALEAANIGSRRVYPPMHTQGGFETAAAFPVADDISRRGLWLPSSPHMSETDVQHVVTTVRRFFAVA